MTQYPKIATCVVCDRDLDVIIPEDETNYAVPGNGTIFRTKGNYGSTLFDTIEKDHELLITICDICILEKEKSFTLYKTPQDAPNEVLELEITDNEKEFAIIQSHFSALKSEYTTRKFYEILDDSAEETEITFKEYFPKKEGQDETLIVEIDGNEKVLKIGDRLFTKAGSVFVLEKIYVNIKGDVTAIFYNMTHFYL